MLGIIKYSHFIFLGQSVLGAFSSLSDTSGLKQVGTSAAHFCGPGAETHSPTMDLSVSAILLENVSLLH